MQRSEHSHLSSQGHQTVHHCWIRPRREWKRTIFFPVPPIWPGFLDFAVCRQGTIDDLCSAGELRNRANAFLHTKASCIGMCVNDPSSCQFMNEDDFVFVSDFALGLFSSHPINPVNTKKMSHRIFRYMHGVLNEVYLQNFLHRWAVNRETNLMNLINP